MAIFKETAFTTFAIQAEISLSSLIQPEAVSGFAASGSVEFRKDWCVQAQTGFSIYGAVQNAVIPSKVRAISQQAVTSALIDLYRLDLSRFNSGIIRFAAENGRGGKPVSFGGELYFPHQVNITGFGKNTQGQFARPKMQVGNLNTAFSALIIGGKDLVGCELTRIRTFADFLDDGGTPDPHQHFPLEVYRIERKTAHNNVYIEWELASIIDVEGALLPRRQILRQHCDYIYRKWDLEKSRWIYGSVLGCPYCGDGMYTTAGVATDNPVQDRCGKSLSACRLRFGRNAPLPFRGFPGADSAR